jgi:hypothetical protein
MFAVMDELLPLYLPDPDLIAKTTVTPEQGLVIIKSTARETGFLNTRKLVSLAPDDVIDQAGRRHRVRNTAVDKPD